MLFINFSVVVDVASIVLGFDMRRLNDVTAFRKCWYRKSVMESFMLGSNHKKAITKTKPSSKMKTAIPEERASTYAVILALLKCHCCFVTAVDPQQEQQQLSHAEIVCIANISDLSCTANVSTVMGNAS